MFKKILICSDGSERAIYAAHVGAELAHKHGAKLALLHVCPLPTVPQPFPAAPTLATPVLERYVRDMHLAVIERTMPAIKEFPGPCEIIEQTGSPVDVITRIAEGGGYDLIVMARRGMAAERAAQLGSVSYGVLHRAHCPVLLVR